MRLLYLVKQILNNHTFFNNLKNLESKNILHKDTCHKDYMKDVLIKFLEENKNG